MPRAQDAQERRVIGDWTLEIKIVQSLTVMSILLFTTHQSLFTIYE